MDTKKTLTGIVLALTIATTPGLSQQEKLNFSLSKPKQQSYRLDIQSRPELRSYIKMQETFRNMGEEYNMVIVPGDRMHIYYPNRNMDPGMEIKPDLKYNRDDKFIIKPDLKWRLPEGWLKKDFYGKPSQGILIYDSSRKRI
jgi:hypothetical protein